MSQFSLETRHPELLAVEKKLVSAVQASYSAGKLPQGVPSRAEEGDNCLFGVNMTCGIEDLIAYLKLPPDHFETGHNPYAVPPSRKYFGANERVMQPPPGKLARLQSFLAYRWPGMMNIVGAISAGALMRRGHQASGKALLAGVIAALGVRYAVQNAAAAYEFVAEDIVGVYRSTFKDEVRVFRGGVVETRYAEELVVGDIVLMHAGSRHSQVQADCRLLAVVAQPAPGAQCSSVHTGTAQGSPLGVDQSTMTGECEAVRKCVRGPSGRGSEMEDDAVVHKGGCLVEGSAAALVVRVGHSTLLGYISGSGLIGLDEDYPEPQAAWLELRLLRTAAKLRQRELMWCRHNHQKLLAFMNIKNLYGVHQILPHRGVTVLLQKSLMNSGSKMPMPGTSGDVIPGDLEPRFEIAPDDAGEAWNLVSQMQSEGQMVIAVSASHTHAGVLKMSDLGVVPAYADEVAKMSADVILLQEAMDKKPVPEIMLTVQRIVKKELLEHDILGFLAWLTWLS